MKEFNTTAVCIPSKHYMVDLSGRVREIRKLVDAGKFFTINRARQYGKTTTIDALAAALKSDYYVVSMDFQDYGEDTFRDFDSFCRDFSCDFYSLLYACVGRENSFLLSVMNSLKEQADDAQSRIRLFTMFQALRRICEASDKPIVLIIDEVDTAANNQLFLDFLGGLRSQYLKREKDPRNKTFQSVVLAGVTDVKHLKAEIRDEDQHKENSPWNIAADFDIDMSLSESGICGMLKEYESDWHTGMDISFFAKQIREYTNGYPFLVSRICQLIDTDVRKNSSSLSDAWTRAGLDEAVKLILAENNTLFQSLTTRLNNYPDLKASLRSILMEGTKLTCRQAIC